MSEKNYDTIPVEPRNDVNVIVEHLLARSLPYTTTEENKV
jgi:hypothetical protein